MEVDQEEEATPGCKQWLHAKDISDVDAVML